MEEFTGNYNRCTDCWHIYDFNDICPNCGGSEIEELNDNDVKEWAKMCVDSEAERLHKLLQLHGDKCPNESSVLPIQHVVCSALPDSVATKMLANCPFEQSRWCKTELKCRFKLLTDNKGEYGCELAL